MAENLSVFSPLKVIYKSPAVLLEPFTSREFFTVTSRQLFCNVTVANKHWSVSTQVSSFIIMPACFQWDLGSNVQIFKLSSKCNSNQYTNAVTVPDSRTFTQIWFICWRHWRLSLSNGWFKSRWNSWNTSVSLVCCSVSRSMLTWFRSWKKKASMNTSKPHY